MTEDEAWECDKARLDPTPPELSYYKTDISRPDPFLLLDVAATALLKSSRVLQDSEKLGHFGLGVRESARGQGVNLAMTAYAYLELVRRGTLYVSYTMVADDNWPSQRTAEKLDAFVCVNYLVYRRNFWQ